MNDGTHEKKEITRKKEEDLRKVA